MNWADVVVLVATVAFFGTGLVGLAVGFSATRTKRFHPAMSYAGLAIGLVPTWLCAVTLLRWWPLIHTSDTNLRLAGSMVALAAAYAAVQALVQVRRAVRLERLERRLGRPVEVR